MENVKKIDAEVENASENTETETTTEPANENWFKKFLHATKNFFVKIGTWMKTTWNWCVSKVTGTKAYSVVREKLAGFFGKVCDLGNSGTEIMKDTGLTQTAAKKSGSLAKRFFGAIKDFLGRHKVIKTIVKVVAIIASIALAVVVGYYAVKMFPAIICGVAEILAAAFIIYGVFFVIDIALGKKDVQEVEED